MKMPFGKYRGQVLDAVPTGYLEWLLSLDDLRNPLRAAVEQELTERSTAEAEPVPVDLCPDEEAAEAIIKAGTKVLARRYHPDAGTDGDHDKMVGINLAADWLRRRLRALAS